VIYEIVGQHRLKPTINAYDNVYDVLCDIELCWIFRLPGPGSGWSYQPHRQA